MIKRPNWFTDRMRRKLYYLSFGLTAGAGAQLLSVGCVTSGQ